MIQPTDVIPASLESLLYYQHSDSGRASLAGMTTHEGLLHKDV